jgi:hypothetical protein
MRIHALSFAHLIARNWSLQQIDAELAKVRKSLASARLRGERYTESIQRRKNAATVALLERKHSNLEYARWLWIDDFRKTEMGLNYEE